VLNIVRGGFATRPCDFLEGWVSHDVVISTKKKTDDGVDHEKRRRLPTCAWPLSSGCDRDRRNESNHYLALL